MPVRLLCLLPDLDVGGAQRTMVNLINAFPVQDFDVQLVVAKEAGAARTWLADPDKLIDIGCPRTRDAVVALRRLVLKSRPDIVFSTMIDANLLATAATLALPDRPALVLRETNSHNARGDLSWLRRRAIGWAYRRADAVIALSSGVKRELSANYAIDEARLAVLPNPVDVSGIRRSLKDASAESRPDGRALVVAVGRLTEQKGFDLLLRAIARLPEPRPRLVILGEGRDRYMLENLARDLGVDHLVSMPGYVADPAPTVAAADLFVLSSRWEGFGHVIVEAMACNTPVVAYDCPYGPADIIDNESTGILVPNGDIEALGLAIARILNDKTLANALAQRAISMASGYQIEHVAAMYRSVLIEAWKTRQQENE